MTASAGDFLPRFFWVKGANYFPGNLGWIRMSVKMEDKKQEFTQ
jgi:hypothetical protein